MRSLSEEIEEEPLINPLLAASDEDISQLAPDPNSVLSKVIEEPATFFDNLNTDILNLGIESGFFVVDETGNVSLDYVFDGGFYKGELAIFSLNGMAQFEPGSAEFISATAKRALSNSELGHIVIGDGYAEAYSLRTLVR